MTATPRCPRPYVSQFVPGQPPASGREQPPFEPALGLSPGTETLQWRGRRNPRTFIRDRQDCPARPVVQVRYGEAWSRGGESYALRRAIRVAL